MTAGSVFLPQSLGTTFLQWLGRRPLACIVVEELKRAFARSSGVGSAQNAILPFDMPCSGVAVVAVGGGGVPCGANDRWHGAGDELSDALGAFSTRTGNTQTLSETPLQIHEVLSLMWGASARGILIVFQKTSAHIVTTIENAELWSRLPHFGRRPRPPPPPKKLDAE